MILFEGSELRMVSSEISFWTVKEVVATGSTDDSRISEFSDGRGLGRLGRFFRFFGIGPIGGRCELNMVTIFSIILVGLKFYITYNTWFIRILSQAKLAISENLATEGY